MGIREGPGERGRRRGRRSLDDALQEFHEARIEGSISQQQVARSIGRSDAWVSWTESGRNAGLSVIDLSQMMACVGLDLSVRCYPAGGGLRDRAQLEIVQRFVSMVVPPWRWNSEVPIPVRGDLRAWDGVLRGVCSIGVDAESRIHDLQAVDRRVMLKLRDSDVDRAVILVPATRSNRAALRLVATNVADNYPITSHRALEALRAGQDPGGNSIIILPSNAGRC
jgi:transcriptional regulator with XRE-family HTH domain